MKHNRISNKFEQIKILPCFFNVHSCLWPVLYMCDWRLACTKKLIKKNTLFTVGGKFYVELVIAIMKCNTFAKYQYTGN